MRYRTIFVNLLVILMVVLSLRKISAQTSWTEYAGNPVLNFGPSGSWDAGVVFLPYVIKTGDTLKMWYAGNGESQIFSDSLQIGYAWSLDGISWARYSGNPVLRRRPNQWDSVGTADPIVVQDGDTLRMWYAGHPSHRIGYATSVDGINWNRLSSVVMQAGPPGEWNADLLFPGGVLKEGGLFKMWFSGGTGTFPFSARISTGYATSPDGITWTIYDDSATTAPPYQFSDPVLSRGAPGSFDQWRAWTARVRTTASGYEMWYAGNDSITDVQAIGYATSPDGIHWTKYSGNPVLTAPNTWTHDIITPSVILDGGQYRMWFSGFQSGFPFAGRIGYATAPITRVEEYPVSGMPIRFSLEQNYPNPFNPTTHLGFRIVEFGFVSLKVFDLLGREVTTIVNEELAPGNYKAIFDGSKLSSGVYFYRLSVGGFVGLRRMVVLK